MIDGEALLLFSSNINNNDKRKRKRVYEVNFEEIM